MCTASHGDLFGKESISKAGCKVADAGSDRCGRYEEIYFGERINAPIWWLSPSNAGTLAEKTLVASPNLLSLIRLDQDFFHKHTKTCP